MQAIQTSVAFKNISDAIEQYRRQFGLAFLALIAFSAIHVGLVVIANLYTMDTRVNNGVLSSAADSSASPSSSAVGTAGVQRAVELSYIMSNVDEDEQKELLSGLTSIDFIDTEDTYRQYTVTGFQLGGWKRSELKLYTSVGHVLQYVRGKGLQVFSEAGETTSTNSTRKLLGPTAPTAPAAPYQMTLTTAGTCLKNLFFKAVITETPTTDSEMTTCLDSTTHKAEELHNLGELKKKIQADTTFGTQEMCFVDVMGVKQTCNIETVYKTADDSTSGIKYYSPNCMQDLIKDSSGIVKKISKGDYTDSSGKALTLKTFMQKGHDDTVKEMESVSKAMKDDSLTSMTTCWNTNFVKADGSPIKPGATGFSSNQKTCMGTVSDYLYKEMDDYMTKNQATMHACNKANAQKMANMAIPIIDAQIDWFKGDDYADTAKKIADDMSSAKTFHENTYFFKCGDAIKKGVSFADSDDHSCGSADYWEFAKKTDDERKSLETKITEAKTMGTSYAKERQAAMKGKFHSSSVWARNSARAVIQTQITNLNDSWSAMKNQNNQEGVLEQTSGATYSTTGHYGCTGQTLDKLQEGNTDFTYVSMDICYNSVDPNVPPLMTGGLFSDLLGSPDDFAMYVSPRFCTNLLAGLNVGKSWIGSSKDSYYTITSDYLIMLHGWGGSSAFLTMSATTLHYAFSGKGDGAFTVCATWSAVTSNATCKSRAAPGGFFVMAPSVGGVPAGMKAWYGNGEFIGFQMDYIIYELPHMMTSGMGLTSRAVGCFGFSMGSFGSINIAIQYPQFVAATGAYNGPLYPNGCFFKFMCHASCILDIITCELTFITPGMAVNAYVILYKDTLAQSLGYYDPMGVGSAKHLLDNKIWATAVLSCKKVEYTPVDSGATSTYYTRDEYGFFAVSDMKSFIGTCTWQDWKVDGTCDTGYSSHFTGYSSYKQAASSATLSARVTLVGFNSYDSDFSCTNLDGTCTTAMSSSDIFIWADFVSNSDYWGSNGDCVSYYCNALKWCAETDNSAGSDNYLDNIKMQVAQMKFLPFSDSLKDAPLVSAYTGFLHTTILMQLYNNPSSLDHYVILMYIHCAPNDEYGLYNVHLDFVGVLGKIDNDGNLRSESYWVFDSNDCDFHNFSERDAKTAILWFTDALRVFPKDMDGSSTFGTTDSAAFALCWTGAHGENPQYGSGSILTHTCAYASQVTSHTANAWTYQFTVREWAGISASNEAHGDKETQDKSKKDIKDKSASYTACTVDFSSSKLMSVVNAITAVDKDCSSNLKNWGYMEKIEDYFTEEEAWSSSFWYSEEDGYTPTTAGSPASPTEGYWWY